MQRVTKLNVEKESPDACDLTWVNVDVTDPEGRNWLSTQSGLSENAKALLLHPSRVCRREVMEHALYVNLCGIDPDKAAHKDRISVGLLIEHDRVITVRSGTIVAIDNVRKDMQQGEGPRTPLEFLGFVVLSFRARLEAIITNISEETDDLEDSVLTGVDDPPLNALSALRSKVFRIRRYLVQIQNVLKLIVSDPAVECSKRESAILDGAAELIARYLVGMQDCRERAQLLHDQIEARLSQTMSNATYKLTIVATVFLPLSFITGLLGMNVGGIPDTHNPAAFWVVCGGLLALAIGAWALLSRKGLG